MQLGRDTAAALDGRAKWISPLCQEPCLPERARRVMQLCRLDVSPLRRHKDGTGSNTGEKIFSARCPTVLNSHHLKSKTQNHPRNWPMSAAAASAAARRTATPGL
jgi:hypothetical protein